MPAARALSPAAALAKGQRLLAQRRAKEAARKAAAEATLIFEPTIEAADLAEGVEPPSTPPEIENAQRPNGPLKELGPKPCNGSNLAPESASEGLAPAERSRRVRAGVSRRKSQLGSVAMVDATEPSIPASSAIERPAATEREIPADLPTGPVGDRDSLQTPTPAAEPQRVGGYRLTDLDPMRCRFACTPDHVRPEDHRFCGAPTRIQPGNLDGSYCDDHLRIVWGKGSESERSAHRTLRRFA